MDSDKRIVVVGSCMIDFVSYAPRLPKAGETIHGTKFATNFGGKGANQCAAAAKLGGKTALIARVGDDTWGPRYIANLKELQIDHSHTKITTGFTSGIAQITVTESGQNQIVIINAANSQLSVEDVENARDLIANAAVVVCQLETNPEVAIKAMEMCRGISILNGAPAIPNCDHKLLTVPSIFCVNESEASVFADCPVNSIEDAKGALKILLEKGCKAVIITLGPEGAIYGSRDSLEHLPTPSVKCLDSTGAGDSFIGSLAFLLASRGDLTLAEGIRRACFIAADSVTRLGTQISFPGPEILELALASS